MTSKIITAFIAGATLSSSWWAFARWPTEINATGAEGVGPVVIAPIICTLVAIVVIFFWIIDNWEK